MNRLDKTLAAFRDAKLALAAAGQLCACGKPAVVQGRCRGCDEAAFYAERKARGESME